LFSRESMKRKTLIRENELGFTGHRMSIHRQKTIRQCHDIKSHRRIPDLQRDETIRRQSEVWRKALTGQYTKHEIEEMLSFIDPDCDRKEWIDIIFILADELGENGRELADRWSRGDLWRGSLQ